MKPLILAFLAVSVGLGNRSCILFVWQNVCQVSRKETSTVPETSAANADYASTSHMLHVVGCWTLQVCLYHRSKRDVSHVARVGHSDSR